MSKRVLCLVTLAALWVGVPFAYAQPRSAQADCGSVAVGGSALGNTININNPVCGIPPEQLEALVQERIKDKTRDLEELSATRKELIKRLEADLTVLIFDFGAPAT